MPLSAQHPHMCDEHRAPIGLDLRETSHHRRRGTRRRRKGTHGTTLSGVPGIFGDRHELALAANSGTIVDGALTILLDIGSNINIIGLKTAQTFERVSRSLGHDIKKLDLTKRLRVSVVGHGAAVCDNSLHCKIACREKRNPAGKPAVARLDTYSANVADGSGENIAAILA
eukprot:1078232-Pyramimonas_sp.AAC.1